MHVEPDVKCTRLYVCHSEIASVGLTEKQARKRIRIKMVEFPFSASGKQRASGTQMVL
jgi:pyruvate/2-oxoglutarate dehydrogenase complex dihydrolipoamide dehydrogenase (E3) component